MEWKGKQLLAGTRIQNSIPAAFTEGIFSVTAALSEGRDARRPALTPQVEALLLWISLARDTIFLKKQHSQNCDFLTLFLISLVSELGKVGIIYIEEIL